MSDTDIKKENQNNDNQEQEQHTEEIKSNEELMANGENFKKILVVDDIMYVVRSISKILREEGYFVITALSGNEALEKFIKYSPDLVTIDQKLPDMTGAQLVEKIKKNVADIDPKILFISAVYDKDEIKAILNLEVDNYLLKPFKKDALLEIVKGLIG